MDEHIIAVYRRIARVHSTSVDDLLVRKALRDEFVTECQRLAGNEVSEEVLLRRLCNLRKQSKLPRTGELADAPATTGPVEPGERD